MRYLILSLIILMATNEIRSQSLNALKWKHRILILMDAQGDLELRKAQLDAFSDNTKAIEERDLLILCYDGAVLLDAKLKPTSYRLAGHINTDFQGIILIGKDGGIKLQKPFPVPPELIFATIDQMPMRKAEMRKSGRY